MNQTRDRKGAVKRTTRGRKGVRKIFDGPQGHTPDQAKKFFLTPFLAFTVVTINGRVLAGAVDTRVVGAGVLVVAINRCPNAVAVLIACVICAGVAVIAHSANIGRVVAAGSGVARIDGACIAVIAID